MDASLTGKHKNYGALKRLAEDRENWKKMTVNPVIEDDTNKKKKKVL